MAKQRAFGFVQSELRKHPARVDAVLDKWLPDGELRRRVDVALSTCRVDSRGHSLQGGRQSTRVRASMVRTLFAVMQEANGNSRYATGKRLWQGEKCRATYGKRSASKPRGMAGRVGVSTRQLGRYLEAFERAKVLQRLHYDGAKVDDCRKGSKSGQAYLQIKIHPPLGDAILRRLERWGQAKPPTLRPEYRPARVETARSAPEAPLPAVPPPQWHELEAIVASLSAS